MPIRVGPAPARRRWRSSAASPALSRDEPALLVSHAYVRYLGDLNGGQVLQRVVTGNAGLGSGIGTRFYEFGSQRRGAGPCAALPRRAGGDRRRAGR